MAAALLITRLLLVFWLSELDYFSAFPTARSYVYPDARQGVRKKQHYGYGNRRPLHYIQALWQPHRRLQSNVHDQVEVKTWQNPQGSSLKDRSHAQTQNQPSVYHQIQTPYQPRSDVATKWTKDPLQRNHPLSKPRSFEFSLKVPFADFLGQNKEASSTTEGSALNSGGSDDAGHYSHLYRPSSVQIYSIFNSASGLDGFSGKGSTSYQNGGKTAYEVSKPSFQLSLSVPIPPTTPSPKPPGSNGGYLANLQRPGSVGFVQNSYMGQTKPQTSESEIIFLNSATTAQQQTEQQTYEPVQTKYTDSTVITFSPGHANQHKTIEQISQGKIPTKQILAFQESSAPSLQIPQNPPLQSDNVHNGYYSAQINPLSNHYGKGQSGEIVLPDASNVHISLSSLQYERIPSGHYNAGQVKPNSNNYGQRQTLQPIGTPLNFASEQYNYGQLKESFGQNVETLPHLSPLNPSSPTVAPSQYELPSFHQDTTTNHYRTGNVVQMGPTDFSSSSARQYSRDQSGQEALPGHLTAFYSSPNFQGLSTDYQTQIRLPGQYTGRGHLDGTPKYTKLFIDVEDVMDSTTLF